MTLLFASDLIARPEKPTGGRRRTALIAGAVVVILVALAVVFVRSRSSAPTPAAEQALQRRVMRSIAVLPLDNYSGDPNQEYFGDGMPDERSPTSRRSARCE